MLKPASLNQRMRSHYLSVADKIDNGSYFDESWTWYTSMSLTPIAERSYMSIVCLFILLASTITFINYQLLGEINTSIPFLIKTPHGSNDFYNIKRLSDDIKESPQRSIADFMITDFLQIREGYHPKDYENGDFFSPRARKIKIMSSKQIYNQYRAYMSQLNPNSPLERYGDHTQRIIDVADISYDSTFFNSTYAHIRFTAKEISLTDPTAKPKFSNWQASIYFRLSDIASIFDSGAPVKFQVTDYRIQKIQ